VCGAATRLHEGSADTLNKRIVRHLDRNLQLGHAYFLEEGKPVDDAHKLTSAMRDKVLPLLQDYCYDDYETLASILGERIVDVQNQRFRPEVIGTGNRAKLLATLRVLIGV